MLICGGVGVIVLNGWKGKGNDELEAIGKFPPYAMPPCYCVSTIRPINDTYNYIEVLTNGNINVRTSTTSSLYATMVVPVRRYGDAS